jgi:hypothetical protein
MEFADLRKGPAFKKGSSPITSVPNKAVESIAEKFKSNNHETPFLVFGQEKNLGKVSAEFLLERFGWFEFLDTFPA